MSGYPPERREPIVCRRCGQQAFERVSRRSVVQLYVLPLLGLWPWRCAVCNDITWRRNRRTTDLSPESPFAP